MTQSCRGSAGSRHCDLRAGRTLPAAVILIAATLLSTGCSDRQKRAWKPRSAEENYRLALESPLGDERRDAVCRIAESGYVTSEDAFHVLDAAARTDSVQQVRCVAVRAFTRYSDPRPVPTLLAILQASPESKEALPAGADVRWEAAGALLEFSRKGMLSPQQTDEARDVYIRLLDSDPSRNVRVIAAEALGTFLDVRVLKPLISALREEDFALADRAERSLIALTGTTHDYDADAWEKWLANTPSPFANAGRIPPTTRPSGPTWFDKQIRAWRRGLKLRNAD